MKGSVVKQKIVDKGYTLQSVAEKIGMSKQNFRQTALIVENIRTDLLEQIAQAIGEPVCYFYNEYPILSLDEYARVKEMESRIAYLEGLLAEKERTIQILIDKNKK